MQNESMNEERISKGSEDSRRHDNSVDQLERQSDEPKKFHESDAGDGSKREEQYLHGVSLALCLVSLFTCLFIFALDQTIVATLLTEVGNKFNSFDQIGWLSSGFLLSMAVFVASWGKISIIFGRKSTMYAAIVLFEAGSLMCALANDMNVLIGGRVLAGVGGGGIQSLVFIIMTEITPIHLRPLGIAALSTIFAIASVLGPLIGGAFTTHVTWRWCFYINLPVGGLAAVIFFFCFNPPKVQGNFKTKLGLIDYFGTFLLIVGLVVFLLALTFGAGNDFAWNSSAVISCFVIGIVFMIIFCIWNFKFSKNPTIPRDVIVIPQVVACAVMLGGMFGYFMATVLYVSIYFQVIHGADGWHSGIHLLPMIIAVVVTSISTGIISNKIRILKPFGVAGALLGPVSSGLLCLLKVDSSNSREIGLLILLGISCGLQMQPALICAQISAPKGPGGLIMATTLVNFGRSLGGTICATLADAVYASAFKNNLATSLKNLKNQEVLQELSGLDLSSLISDTSAIASLSPATQRFVKDVVMEAIRNVFYMCIGFAGLCTIASLFVTNKRLPKSNSEGPGAEEKKPKSISDDDGIVNEEDSQGEVKSINVSGDENENHTTFSGDGEKKEEEQREVQNDQS